MRRCDEFQPAGLDHNRAWNTAVLTAALADGGKAPEYLSIHPLVPLPGGLQDRSYEERFESAMAHPAFLDKVLLPGLAEQIQADTEKAA